MGKEFFYKYSVDNDEFIGYPIQYDRRSYSDYYGRFSKIEASHSDLLTLAVL